MSPLFDPAMRRVFFVERKNPSSEPEYTGGVNLKLNWWLETASTQSKPRWCAGFKSLISD